jgi:phosphonate transport system substrate-binding protein
MAQYIGDKLGPDVKGGVVIAKDLDQLTRLIQEKKVEIYMESAYPTYVINKRTGARILARRWKGRVPEYSTVLFTRRGSGITEPKDLLGKMVAFEDRGSTSGYLLPNAYLARRGFKLAEKSSFTDPVSPQEIGYVFAHGSETNILNWVLLGKVSAGAFNDNAFAQIQEERRRELAVFAETAKLPRHLLSVRGDLDPQVVARVQDILLTMHEDEAGRKALRKALKTSKFDLVPGGEETVYKRIEELFGVLGKNTH